MLVHLHTVENYCFIVLSGIIQTLRLNGATPKNGQSNYWGMLSSHVTEQFSSTKILFTLRLSLCDRATTGINAETQVYMLCGPSFCLKLKLLNISAWVWFVTSNVTCMLHTCTHNTHMYSIATHARTHTHTHTHTQWHVHISVYINTHTQSHTHHTHVYIHVHTHMHSCTWCTEIHNIYIYSCIHVTV